jgi:hypothetical protein
VHVYVPLEKLTGACSVDRLKADNFRQGKIEDDVNKAEYANVI